jgi:Protein of unknown function (DUF2804)
VPDHVEALVARGTRAYGRFAGRPGIVNPLDEFSGVSRRLRRLRLKEWVGFTLVHPDLYSSMIIQDANYLASSELYVYDREAGALYQHAANARGGSLRMPEVLSGSHPAFARPGYRLEYSFAADDTGDGGTGGGQPHRIVIDIAATDKAPAVRAALELDAGRVSAPLSVSSRIPGGKLYTHKAVFPVTGSYAVGNRSYTFDPARDLAIIDEHKSLFPYMTRWLWGTLAFAGPDGAPVGANFCARPGVAGEEEESCVWTPGGCEPLSGITFTPSTGGSPMAPWQVASADGRLELTFVPEGRKDVKVQLGVAALDYYQLFGSYRGALRSLDGAMYAVADAHGVCESFRARL